MSKLARYDGERLEIFLADVEGLGVEREHNYRVDLTEIRKPTDIAEWVAHLRQKTWFTDSMLAAFRQELGKALTDNGFNPDELPAEMTWREPKPGKETLSQ